jgi:hypothetical protein
MGMKRRTVPLVCGLVVAALVGVAFVPSTRAQQGQGQGQGGSSARQQQPCSVETLQGSYGIAINGTDVTAGLLATVGVFTFDREGAFAATVSRSVNGQIFPKGADHGLFTVAPDCTGTLQHPDAPPHWDLVIVDGGNEFFAIRTDPGTITTMRGKRQ